MGKITDKQFKVFESEANKWVEYLQLKDYHLMITKEDLEDDDVCATCTVNIDNANAHIRIQDKIAEDEYCTDKAIRQVAKHEVLELLLAEVWQIGQKRWANIEEFDRAKHRVISRLVNVL